MLRKHSSIEDDFVIVTQTYEHNSYMQKNLCKILSNNDGYIDSNAFLKISAVVVVDQPTYEQPIKKVV